MKKQCGGNVARYELFIDRKEEKRYIGQIWKYRSHCLECEK